MEIIEVLPLVQLNSCAANYRVATLEYWVILRLRFAQTSPRATWSRWENIATPMRKTKTTTSVSTIGVPRTVGAESFINFFY